ncbi:hypothetical protein B0A52_09364 [Exophiala mesophila]|uniref:L-ornithine N(5)-oxygenase n=1 Tax=Exophiala mesophila TaxID=212818 RepID=A0A438MU02_EXOME|nr:hypothetical protein B0A52_09364 [Exophiala mesophila]
MAVPSDPPVDLVVVGAGWHGLAVAKTYTEVSPTANVLILDTAQSIGGVWAKERLYPGLKTNNLVGSYEFGDFPMTPERFGLTPGQHIPGAVVHQYLNAFADEFGLTSKLRFQTRVETAELQDNGDWVLNLSSVSSSLSSSSSSPTSTPSVLRTKKLVVATGLTSEPYMPEFPGRSSFNGRLLHSINLKERSKDIEASREVVVLGANKSAWDTCFSAATAGAHVTMVIRPGGGGPSWVWPVTFTPFHLSIQRLATTRFCSLFDPCIWAQEGNDNRIFNWTRWMLHKTWLGQKLVGIFWGWLGSIICKANAYDTHPELAKLKPWSSTFWMGNSLGVHNYDSNWFDLVRKGRISVQIADVSFLSEKSVHLSNDQVLDADTFVCCTGWKTTPPIKFLPESIVPDLGIPCMIPAGQQQKESDLQSIHARVLQEAPMLRRGPVRTLHPSAAAVPAPVPIPNARVNNDHDKPNIQSKDHWVQARQARSRSSYQLYRFLVPSDPRFLHHRNIAFIGTHLAINAVTVAQAQALWITAFFTSPSPSLSLSRLDPARVDYDTLLHNEYCRLRHPHAGGGAGDRCPDLCFDGLMYTDLLIHDLGLNVLRKGRWWKDLFCRYQPADYCGLTREWMEKAL